MYFPLYFKTDNLCCLVVGGGKIASRKVIQMADAGCEVTIIAPEICGEISGYKNRGNLEIIQRKYSEGDCKGYQLIIAATGDRDLNRRIFDEAQGLCIPVNVVDDPELCTVVFSAVWRDDPLSIAVSTGGVAPFLAAEIRNRLADAVEGYGNWVRIGGKFRELILKSVQDSGRRRRLLNMFAQAGPPGTAILPPQSDDLDEWLVWLEKVNNS